MNRMRYIKEHAGRIGLTILLFCLIVYTVYHAVGGSAGSLQTTPVRQVTDTALVTGEGWLFRDETILTVSQNGLVNPLATSGTKVGRNTKLFEVYQTGETDLTDAQTRLDALNRQIALLQASLLPEGSKLSEAAGYRDEVMKKLSDIRAEIRSGSWIGVGDAEEEILVALSRYGSLLSSEDGIRTALEQLIAERDGMLTGEKQTVSNENASGYYYARETVDGLEERFSVTALETLTGETFAELQNAEPVSGDVLAAGKICYDYRWYLALTLPADVGGALEVDTTYTVRFPENRDRELTLTCTDLRDAGDGNGTVLVILRSDVTPADFSFRRCQTVELTTGESSGLYIPEQAVVTRDGMTGVYVFNSGTVNFRRIATAVARDGYLLAAGEDPDPENEVPYVKLNDLMVLSGKNLYDGKVYRQ